MSRVSLTARMGALSITTRSNIVCSFRHQFRKGGPAQKFSGIRCAAAAGEHEKLADRRREDAGSLAVSAGMVEASRRDGSDRALQIGGADQVIDDAREIFIVHFVRGEEDLVKAGPTQVAIDQEHPMSLLGEGEGVVRTRKTFAFARSRAREQEDFSFRFRSKKGKRRAQIPE